MKRSAGAVEKLGKHDRFVMETMEKQCAWIKAERGRIMEDESPWKKALSPT